MDFEEAERRYDELKRQFEARNRDAEYFNAERGRRPVREDEGRWWTKSQDSDEWSYYNGNASVTGAPQ